MYLWGTTSPLGSKFALRVEVKNGPLPLTSSAFRFEAFAAMFGARHPIVRAVGKHKTKKSINALQR
jgi:hypothetical protein